MSTAAFREGGPQRVSQVALREQVLAALDGVIDPELDEPITTLRFVSSVTVTPAREVEVLLRLPTPQCAPNFAFLMAADARDAVRRLPEVRGVTVHLEDHYTGQEINAALSRGEGFTGAFPGTAGSVICTRACCGTCVACFCSSILANSVLWDSSRCSTSCFASQ